MALNPSLHPAPPPRKDALKRPRVFLSHHQTIERMDPKEMGIFLETSCWEKERAPTRGEACLQEGGFSQ